MNIDPIKSGELVRALQLEIDQLLTYARCTDVGSNSWELSREQVQAELNTYVAAFKARGLPVADWGVNVQEATSYTISRSGKICLWDQDKNVIDIKVKSRSTSRRLLHRRARSKIGHMFAFIKVQPIRPAENIVFTVNVNSPLSKFKDLE